MFLQYPDQELIENQDEIWNMDYFPKKLNNYENIIVTFRQDLSVITEQISLFFGIFALVLILKTIFFGNIDDDSISYLIEGVVYGIGAIEIVIFAYFFHNYFMSQIVITNKRIIQITQTGFLSSKVEQHLIERFKTIKIDRERARYVLGDKGHITIEMKETTNIPPLLMEHVPKPEEIEQIVKNQMF